MKMIEEFTGEYNGYKLRVRHFDGEFPDSLPGLSYAFNRHWWCGYVELPIDHPWYNLEYMDIDVECHGGLTFKDRIDGDMYIGFDCNHYLDDPIYNDGAYCIRECESIIRQMIYCSMKGDK